MARKLRIFGQEIQIGRDEPVKPGRAKKEKMVVSELGAAFLDLSGNSLVGNKTVSDKLLKAYEGWVYANVSVLAEEISKIEFELYKTVIVKGAVEWQQIDSHPVLDLLDRWNPFTTTSDAIYMTAAHLELAGDTFYLLDSPTNPKNIFILEPDKVEVVPGDAEDHYEIKEYKYKTMVDGKWKETTYPGEVVIQVKNPNPNNPYRGKSAVEAAAISIDTDNLAEEFLKSFFRNAAVPNFALSSDQRITRDDIQRLEVDLRKNYGGVRNAFKTLILGGGLKPVSVQQSGREMQFLEIELALRDKIMAMFKNTKSSLGITDDVNRANAEASILSWKQSVIKPKMQRITDTLNEFLVPRFGQNLILTFCDPVPEDRVGVVAEAKTLKEASLITVNEGRGMVGLDPLDGEEFDTIQTFKPSLLGSFGQQETPQNLFNVNFRKHYRHNVLGYVTEQKALYAKATKAFKKAYKPKPPKKVEAPESQRYLSFNNERAMAYWEKQIQITEVVETRFESKIQTFLQKLLDKAVGNLPKVVPKTAKTKAFELFDMEDEVLAGIDLFTPLVQEVSGLAGSEAWQLLNQQALYIPSEALKRSISVAVERFTRSMLDTDREQLTKILQEGLANNEGVAAIERRIREDFGGYTQTQSTRITRTEMIRASNDGALDAFIESGVVSGKQWITAPADDECEQYNGMTVWDLGGNFYGPEGEFQDGDPPLHPNCRCVVIPVIGDRETSSEAEVTKLTRELAETKEYVRELEKVIE